MQKDAAERLIEDTFRRAFDEDAFRVLVRNLFKDPDEKHTPAFTGAYIYDSFRDHVRQFKRIAKYIDPEGEEIDVLAVELKRTSSLDRARTMQRNFAAEYLKRKEREAALIAYYTDGAPDWRLSLVRVEYRTVQDEQGRVKTKEELSPARRYSFLVGEGEPSHTAQRQFLDLLVRKAPPPLSDLETAFDIEKVTEEFFEQYKALFLQLKDELDALVQRDDRIRQEFAGKSIDTGNFAKKLLGQLVFLYFLQKKGWLGVGRHDTWGSGPKDFIRRLFKRRYADYNNFFNDILEPLFYEALATDRGTSAFYSPFSCKIPFLNGGLFEPIGDYDWTTTDILISNSTFEQILDTFDRYNFTVREDEPLEKEVAVDPEMLGKVFENLLEVTDRKSKGAFYTPREIVHYMCQQSLIDYLDGIVNTQKTPLARAEAPQSDAFRGIPGVQTTMAAEEYRPRVRREDLALLVQEGDRWAENDRRVQDAGRETRTYQYQLPESIRDQAALIDEALASIKICDPAIGSGAFPVGMMQEIVRARCALSTYLPDDPERTPYNFKRHAIQHAIYGVDIDPGAVDIARLRLWLSLVVDEADFQTIKPLPNLHYRIVQGNALLHAGGMAQNEAVLHRLQGLIDEQVVTSQRSRRKELEEEIDRLIRNLTGGRIAFDFEVYFSEVFQEHAGFDVVIGNPPYVRQETLGAKQKEHFKAHYQTYAGTADLYTYFIERGMGMLRPGGVFCYIVSNKWMRARYGTALRRWLKQQHLAELIDFGDLPVFQGITTYPCILRMVKTQPAKAFRAVEVESLDYEDLTAYVQERAFEVDRTALDDAGWALVDRRTQRLLDRLNKIGVPLSEYVGDKPHYGIKTGYNRAFVINAAERERLIKEDPRSTELIRPFLTGRDIKRYLLLEFRQPE